MQITDLDYRLIAIADQTVLGDRNVVDACMAAEAGGATCIQLRMKTSPASEMLGAAEATVKSVTVPVFINDRVDIALLSGAAGVHLGWDDISIDLSRSIKSTQSLHYGLSVGDEGEAADATGLEVDYWGSGPVFGTLTKNDAGDAIGIHRLSKLVSLAGMTPVVAVGGIQVTDCEALLSVGVRGVAIIGGIFGSGDIEANARGFREALDRFW